MNQGIVAFTGNMIKWMRKRTMSAHIMYVTPPPQWDGDTAQNIEGTDMWTDGYGGRHRVCRLGKVGDIVMVKEPFFEYGHYEQGGRHTRTSGKPPYKFVRNNDWFRYSSNPPRRHIRGFNHWDIRDWSKPCWHIRKARYMPHSKIRYLIRITDIQCMRLQSIPNDILCDMGFLPEHVVLRYRQLVHDGKQHTDDYKVINEVIQKLLQRYINKTVIWMFVKCPRYKYNPWFFTYRFKLEELRHGAIR